MTNNRFPCLLCSGRWEGGVRSAVSLFLKSGKDRGRSKSRARGMARWSASPFGVVCREHGQYPAFAPDTLLLPCALQKWKLGL